MINIRQAQFPDDMSAVQAIFREYVASPSVSLEFQDYEAEFAALPGKYAAPRGRLLLAWQAGTVVGCAAFREVNAATCEMKRVYVRPAARGAHPATATPHATPHSLRPWIPQPTLRRQPRRPGDSVELRRRADGTSAEPPRSGD